MAYSNFQFQPNLKFFLYGFRTSTPYCNNCSEKLSYQNIFKLYFRRKFLANFYRCPKCRSLEMSYHNYKEFPPFIKEQIQIINPEAIESLYNELQEYESLASSTKTYRKHAFYPYFYHKSSTIEEKYAPIDLPLGKYHPINPKNPRNKKRRSILS